MADRKHADDRRDVALRQVEACLAQVPVLLTVSDCDARYLWSFGGWGFSGLAGQIALGPEQLMGRTDLELGAHPSLRRLHQLKLRALELREPCVEAIPATTFAGPRTFEVTATPVFDDDAALLGVVSVGVDVSELHAARELRSERREEQLRLLSHDLRQPLNVIAIAAARLASVVEVGSPLSSLSERITASVRAMTQVLEDVVESGEWETGALLLRREPIDVAAFLRETLTAGVAPEGLLRLRLEIEPPCVAAIDRAKLGRAVLNLVDNALKFSTAEAPVVVSARIAGDKLQLAVSDRGPGLDPDTAAHAFDKYRASRRSRAAGGHGLGLYCAKLIVEAHGGSCRVESRPGQGATFAIELPSA